MHVAYIPQMVSQAALKILVRLVWLSGDIWEDWGDLIPLLTDLILCLGLTLVCPLWLTQKIPLLNQVNLPDIQ